MTTSIAPQSVPVFQAIANDVAQRVMDGEFAPGERLMSIAEVCKQYGVSVATAQRSITSLADRGVVRTLPRKGVYVAAVPTMGNERVNTESVQRLVVMESITNQSSRSHVPHKRFTEQIAQAVVASSRDACVPLHFEYVQTRAGQSQPYFFKPRPGDGVIVVGASVCAALAAQLIDSYVPSIIIDACLPNTASVITDNFTGMNDVATHLASFGHKRVVLAAGFGSSTRSMNHLNENERRDAFIQAAQRNAMETIVEQNGDRARLFKLLKSKQPPTAVVFTRDKPAIEFIRDARARGISVPGQVSVVGFDDWAYGDPLLEELTTVHIDLEAFGRRAVEHLLNFHLTNSPIKPIFRVAPKLVTRQSVGRSKHI